MKLRLIDAGKVSALRSQTIYHALAYTRNPETPDTVVLNTSEEPYVCIGYHQDLKKEVDVDFCAAQQIPVIRRETGGGTVYLDDNQLLVQWIFEPRSLPRKIDARFRLFIEPLIETYKFFGINAYYHPPNDVHVRNKKIVGTGAAAIGQAEVVTGNFLFDFNNEVMARVLNVPDDNFREKVLDSLQKYMTTMKRELGAVPDREEVKAVYIEKCAAALGRPLEKGSFTEEEYRMMELLDEKYVTNEWLFQHETEQRGKRQVKIHAGVWLYETDYKTAGGLIRMAIRTKGSLIDHLSISGDLAFQPAQRLRELENLLRNIEVAEENLTEAVETFYEMHQIDSPGIVVGDWVAAILQIRSLNH